MCQKKGVILVNALDGEPYLLLPPMQHCNPPQHRTRPLAQNAPFSPDTLMDLLKTVQDPQTGLSLASAGRLESCTVDEGGRMTLTLTVPREQAPALSALCDAAAKKLQTLPNITSATINPVSYTHPTLPTKRIV